MIIETKGLYKQYKDKTVALDSVTFNIEELGKIYGFIGPNGAGKTTLIRILSTQLHFTTGFAQILGYDLRTQKKEIRKHISVLPQDFALPFYELTTEDMIYYYLRILGLKKTYIKKKIDTMLEMFDLTKYRKTQVEKLSGGFIRRTYLAMVLAVDADIYFLDEPTVGLDPTSKLFVWSSLHTMIKEGKTILLTSHYMEEISQLCYQVFILNYGKIIMNGSPSTLLKKHFNNLTHKIIIHPDNTNFNNVLATIQEHGNFHNIRNELIIVYPTDVLQLEQELTKQEIRFEIAPLSLEDVALDLRGV